jgi:hypothetical protein
MTQVVDLSHNMTSTIASMEQEYNEKGFQLTPGEAKRIELIRKMKEDTDKIEYMYMLNCLIGALLIVAVGHFIAYRSWVSIMVMIMASGYFVLAKTKLKQATVSLLQYKNDFDRYLWEGFYLKEMRFSAVKLAYVVFFPFFVMLFVDLISDTYTTLSWTIKIAVALAISSIAWLIYFEDDNRNLETIESDLNALKFL